MLDLVQIFIACILVLLNAFFVAAEFSMVKLRATQVQTIQHEYGLRGRLLAHIHKHLDAYLSACQLGITIASLGLGWIGEPAFAHLLVPILTLIGVTKPEVVAILAFFLAFSFISFLHIVVGELMPKSVAIRRPEKISLWTSLPLYGFYWLMYPTIWVLNSCSNFFLKLLGLADTPKGESFYSTEEIKLLLSAGHLHGELTEVEAEMLEHTLEFADLKVTELMRPKEEMVMLDLGKSMDALMQTIMEHRYSRYPVFDAAKGEIIGIIHTKDLLSTLYQQGEILEIQSLLRPVLKVNRKLPALDLLHTFREGMPHFALIYAKPKVLMGFVTLDNLLHVLIGRIKDEFHRTKVDWIANPDGSLLVAGDCSIYSLEQALDEDINHPEDLERVSELVMHILGKTPAPNDRLYINGHTVLVEKMQGSKIMALKIWPKIADEPDQDY